MKSTIIRFTDKKYAQSYLDGKLYLSSLSKFWNIENTFEDQKDFGEGIAAAAPKDLNILPIQWQSMQAFDIRFRVEAYKYCNLLCFYRVDIDEENNIIQLPPASMNEFGDAVIIVRNERVFINRVITAVQKAGGICITGDVRYHRIEDSLNPGKYPKHSLSLVSADNKDGSPGLFPLNALLGRSKAIKRYGCLDKYDRYADQREWRICVLPNMHNEEDLPLEVGDFRDVISVLPTSELRGHLLALNPGCMPGCISEQRRFSYGMMHYSQFKQHIEAIDGMCRLIMDIG